MSTEKIDFLDEEGNCKDNQQQQGLPLIERNNADHDNTEAGQVVATTELQKKQEEQDDMTIIAKETKARKRNKISPIKETDQHAAAALEDRVSSNSATELLEVTKTGDGDGGEVLPKKSPKKTDQIVEKIHVVEEKINSFFQREWQAFKSEKQKKLRQIPKKITTLDFKEMILEFKKRGRDPSRHWTEQAKKKEGEKCPELLTTVITGLLFTLIPNCAIVLDYITASEYLGGEYYLKYSTDNVTDSTICRPVEGREGYFECKEWDPVYGILTLSLTFISGIFWSFQIFYQFSTHLRQSKPEFWQRKRMIVLFFIPLSILCIISFPLQLFFISLIACFHDQDQWMLLTIKIGIAEGLFNAHFQYMLQLFIFFTRADRHPSAFQYLTAFGSLLFLAYSRVESLMLDREGHKMSPGQKAWWIIRYGPNFLLNCAFKVGSISLIVAMLRFNCIWVYGSVVIIWLVLQLCFNEGWIPRRFYHLFLGAGMHAVSVAHIPEQIKLIDTNPDSKKNVLWATRLSSRQLRQNLLFQNMIWFILNVTIMVTLWLLSCDNIGNPNTEIPLFWPFTTKTYTFKDNKVFSILQYVVPTLLSTGLVSQMLLWLFEERKILTDIMSPDGPDSPVSSDQDDVVDGLPGEVPGWQYVDSRGTWHRYKYDEQLGAGVQGRLNQVIYPLLNIWGNWVDKNTN